MNWYKRLFAAITNAAPHNEEWNLVENNLRNAGHELRDNGNGHWVLPSGRGLSPTNRRGIVNHWESAVDAGYLPKSYLNRNGNDYFPHSEIIHGLLSKGWLRKNDSKSFASWGLPQNHVKFIQDYLLRESKFQPENTSFYIDDAKKGIYYSFTIGQFIQENGDLIRTLRKAEKHQSMEKVDPMQWGIPEHSY